MVKYIFDTCNLKILFLGTLVLFCFINGTWVLKKKLIWYLYLFFCPTKCQPLGGWHVPQYKKIKIKIFKN